MKYLILFLTLFLTLESYAQSRGDALRQIRRKVVEIEDATYETEASMQSLAKALKDLEKIRRNLVNGSDDSIYQGCVDFSYPILDRFMSSSDALDRAMAICPEVTDLEVLNFVYTQLDRVMSGRDAITKAAQVAREDLTDKLEVLTYAFEKHNRNHSRSSAIEKAIKNARISSINAVVCFKKYYPTYSRSQSSSAAMDRTAQTCSRF